MMSKFSFCHYVFKCRLLQRRQKVCQRDIVIDYNFSFCCFANVAPYHIQAANIRLIIDCAYTVSTCFSPQLHLGPKTTGQGSSITGYKHALFHLTK